MQTCYCPSCGKKLTIPDSSNPYMFCQYCGTKINLSAHSDNFTEPFDHIVNKAKAKNSDAFNRLVDVVVSPIEEKRAKKRAEEERKRREEEEAERKRQEQLAREEEEARAYAEYRSAQNEKYARQLGRMIAKAINYYKANTQKCLIIGGLVLIVLVSACVTSSNDKQRAKELAAHSAELARLEEERIANSHLAMGEVLMPSFSSYGDYRKALKKLKDAGFINITVEGKGDLIFGILDDENDIIEITVDGSPEFEKDTWYPMDVPIFISYHSFYSNDSDSSSSSESVSTSSASAISESEREDFCFANDESNYKWCIWISPSEKLVRQFAYYSNGLSLCMTGHITSGSYDSGYTVHFEFSDGETTGWNQTFKIKNNKLITDYDDGGSDTYDTPINMNSVYEAYNGSWIEVPEGRNPSEFISEYIANYSANASSSASSESSSITEETTLGYIRTTGNYSIYYYIDFEKDTAYYFVNGNGDRTAQKAKIVSGNYKEGITIHFSYDSGWDEKLSFSKYDMTLTDANGHKYSFSKAPTGAVKQILDTKTVIR